MNTTFSLPAGVDIDVQDPDLLSGEMFDYFGDVLNLYGPQFESQNEGDAATRRLCVNLRRDPTEEGLRRMEDGVMGRSGVMLDRKLKTLIRRSSVGEVLLDSTTAPLEWLTWIVQLLLLERRATFVHCAGLEKNGRSILFPSWGGVGKTAITKHFIWAEGWRLLGDDLVIVDDEGTSYAFPRAMVLYPYHKSVFPDVFAQGEGPVAPTMMNEFLTGAALALKPVLRRAPAALRWARSHNPQSVRIAPTKVFGPDVIASNAAVDTVVWLERDALLATPKIESADSLYISRIAGTTLSEFTRHCVDLTPTMFGLGLFSLEHSYGAWHTILEAAFEGKNKWMISIPASMPVAEVPTAVVELLDSVDFRNGF